MLIKQNHIKIKPLIVIFIEFHVVNCKLGSKHKINDEEKTPFLKVCN